ncbi:hypothetical protein EVG20_g11289 [Dentipellis fragilis]|uniref:Uncharacterized protein n=1 Tax=Dentipellis fragilis TaxID=205917 RepID=A0A4Y9XNB4_9AGAM|nr:hypothetical protein EVG20_g11289 [Dentipellis fragilis]
MMLPPVTLALSPRPRVPLSPRPSHCRLVYSHTCFVVQIPHPTALSLTQACAAMSCALPPSLAHMLAPAPAPTHPALTCTSLHAAFACRPRPPTSCECPVMPLRRACLALVTPDWYATSRTIALPSLTSPPQASAASGGLRGEGTATSEVQAPAASSMKAGRERDRSAVSMVHSTCVRMLSSTFFVGRCPARRSKIASARSPAPPQPLLTHTSYHPHASHLCVVHACTRVVVCVLLLGLARTRPHPSIIRMPTHYRNVSCDGIYQDAASSTGAMSASSNVSGGASTSMNNFSSASMTTSSSSTSSAAMVCPAAHADRLTITDDTCSFHMISPCEGSWSTRYCTSHIYFWGIRGSRMRMGSRARRAAQQQHLRLVASRRGAGGDAEPASRGVADAGCGAAATFAATATAAGAGTDSQQPLARPLGPAHDIILALRAPLAHPSTFLPVPTHHVPPTYSIALCACPWPATPSCHMHRRSAPRLFCTRPYARPCHLLVHLHRISLHVYAITPVAYRILAWSAWCRLSSRRRSRLTCRLAIILTCAVFARASVHGHRLAARVPCHTRILSTTGLLARSRIHLPSLSLARMRAPPCAPPTSVHALASVCASASARLHV